MYTSDSFSDDLSVYRCQLLRVSSLLPMYLRKCSGNLRDLPVLTHPFLTRRSSDLRDFHLDCGHRPNIKVQGAGSWVVGAWWACQCRAMSMRRQIQIGRAHV